MRIQTPVEGFTGEVVGVSFVDGFGEPEAEAEAEAEVELEPED